MAQRRLSVLCSHLHLPSSPQRCPSIGLSPSPSSAFDADTSAGASDIEKDCIFCMIILGESPAFKLYEDDLCICILDLNPLSHGHSLLIPKAHYSSLETTPPSVVAAMCSKVPFLSRAIMKSTNCDSFNLLVNNGAAAGQVIFHTHFHIIPRKACDRLWTHQSFRRKPLKLDQETAHLVDCIREQLLLHTNNYVTRRGLESKIAEST